MTCCRQELPCDLRGMLPSFSHTPGDFPCAKVMDLAVDAASANVTCMPRKKIGCCFGQSKALFKGTRHCAQHSSLSDGWKCSEKRCLLETLGMTYHIGQGHCTGESSDTLTCSLLQGYLRSSTEQKLSSWAGCSLQYKTTPAFLLPVSPLARRTTTMLIVGTPSHRAWHVSWEPLSRQAPLW